MKQNMGRLIRYILIIHKLSGHKKYVSVEELISYLNLQMELRGYEIGISQRTLQRNIKDIADMFDVEIKNYRGYGYYISDRLEETDIKYQELLLNFDLLTSMNQGSQSVGYIIPEHHRPKGSACPRQEGDSHPRDSHRRNGTFPRTPWSMNMSTRDCPFLLKMNVFGK